VALARAIGSNTVATAIARFSILLVWLWTTPAILSALGGNRFGLWSILFVVTQVLASLDFGIGTAVSRFVGELAGRGSPRGARSLLGKAALLQIALILVLAVPTLLLRDAILSFFPVDPAWRDEARDAFAIAILAFAAGAAANLLVAALQGLQRMDLAVRIFVPAAVLLFAGVRWAVGRPDPLRALTLVQAGYALVVAVAAAVAVAVAFDTIRKSPGPEAGGRAIGWRALVALGSWVQVTTLFGLVQNHVDKVLLGRFASLELAGSFEIAARVTNVLFLPAMFFLGAFLPALARHEAGRTTPGDAAERRAIYRIAFAPYGAFVLGMTGALVALAAAVLEAWLATPPRLAEFMLRMVALAASFNLLTGIGSILMRAWDRAHAETAYAVIMVTLHVVLSVVGFHAAGPAGILLGAVVSALLMGAWFNARTEAWLGGSPLGETAHALAPSFTAAAVATFTTGLLDSILALGEPGRARGVLRLAVGSTVYAGVFLGVLRLAFPARWTEIRGRLGRVLAGATDAVR
jgi:O-antigen/teichoic acid export membrane protein